LLFHAPTLVAEWSGCQCGCGFTVKSCRDE
jgi:hypothetical protein